MRVLRLRLVLCVHSRTLNVRLYGIYYISMVRTKNNTIRMYTSPSVPYTPRSSLYRKSGKMVRNTKIFLKKQVKKHKQVTR